MRPWDPPSCMGRTRRSRMQRPFLRPRDHSPSSGRPKSLDDRPSGHLAILFMARPCTQLYPLLFVFHIERQSFFFPAIYTFFYSVISLSFDQALPGSLFNPKPVLYNTKVLPLNIVQSFLTSLCQYIVSYP